MPSHLTKSQRAKQKSLAQRRKEYQDNKRRKHQKDKSLWYHNFIGKVPINDLYRCFNITP